MKKLRFLISLPTSKNDFQLAQASSAEQMGQKRAIDLEIVYADITMQYCKVRKFCKRSRFLSEQD